MRLVIANKLYSTWSMRPWLVLSAFDIPFEEKVIPLRHPETRADILAHSPTGKVPVLEDGGVRVWESLAIIEYLAEKFPSKPIWPADSEARAAARSAASEMHAGFQALRIACPMNLGKRFAPRDRGAEVAANVERIEQLWRDLRSAYASAGPFLFGAFTAADAMYEPVASRFDTYQLPVAADTRSYMEAILAHPAVNAWRAGALVEPWRIAEYEVGETPVESFHQVPPY